MIRLVVLSVLVVSALGASLKNETSDFVDGRIVGGLPEDILDFPYLVAILDRNGHFCGGSLLNFNTVLTAAHCFNDILDRLLEILLMNIFTVRAGSSNHDTGGYTVGVSRIIVHPKYNILNYDYDVAILKLKSFLPSDDARIKYIRLPNEGFVIPDNETILVSGWGVLWENGPKPSQLEAVDVDQISNDICQEKYDEINKKITERMMCAGDLGQGGKDACQGDSGGPAIYNFTLVGVVSWGEGCGEADYPGVYAKVANPDILNWIDNYV
ncbi:hypothetical protein DMENIID0001_040680 [Sergentomyia squamirostris]